MGKYLLSLFYASLLCVGCRETPPSVDFAAPIIPLKDSTFIAVTAMQPQHKAILIEDITGVRCNNCPAAAKLANDIVSSKTKDSVIVMALHPLGVMPNFTNPWPNVPQLSSDLSKQLVESLSIPTGLPSGYIDRKIFPGKQYRTISHTEWLNYVNERLKLTTPVNINLSRQLVNRKVTVEIQLAYNTLSSSGKQHKLAIYLTESGIVSTQQNLANIENNYVHNHALRYSFASPLGIVLNESTVPGRTYVKQYAYEIPSDYNISNCHIVCLVLDAVTEEVINVRQLDL